MRYHIRGKMRMPVAITAEGQANLEATIHRALELGIKPHRNRARLRHLGGPAWESSSATAARERMIIQTKVSPCADPKEFLATFNKSMSNLQLDHVDLLGLHGINNEEVLDFAMRRGGCLQVARQLQKEGRVRFNRVLDARGAARDYQRHRIGEFDYVNLHWYFVNPLNWSSVEAATKQTWRVHHQPERQGRHVAERRRPKWRHCARR